MLSPFLTPKPGTHSLHQEDFCSVVIISCNRHNLLQQCIDSVHQHADMPFELIVADDAGFLYNDYNSFYSMKDKVTKFYINTGQNMGLPVNTNMGISLASSRNIVLLSDDSMILKPFMRQSIRVLDSAPYVGGILLGHTFTPIDNKDSFLAHCNAGILQAKTPSNDICSLLLGYGSSWACVFRKNCWYEVGGYAEYDIYGDTGFLNRLWERGKFTSFLTGGDFAVDVDKQDGITRETTGRFLANNRFCNFPKIFGWDDSTLLQKGATRNRLCSQHNHRENHIPFGANTLLGWKDYIVGCMKDGNVDFDKLSQRFGRYINEIKRDVCLF